MKKTLEMNTDEKDACGGYPFYTKGGNINE